MRNKALAYFLTYKGKCFKIALLEDKDHLFRVQYEQKTLGWPLWPEHK